MILQPQSWHEDVWTDVTRMLSLNSAQSAAGREMHLCPMQFDLADRAIAQYTMEGETVFDPFAGIGTVPLRALKLRRKGYGVELAEGYFRDAVYYCQAAEREVESPTLFDLTEEEEVPA
jgi:DNA modification methylase